ncbi:hypothetical protein RRG08_024357 [Elysia crispata]|uniref:Uncharacterized protein n=1 Tax=Elysia crispata TaxID=231223 RepID=A0AAE0ZKP2_9GAST|nr:hypothetical protein RRG08_024357 [Elysia crispata]
MSMLYLARDAVIKPYKLWVGERGGRESPDRLGNILNRLTRCKEIKEPKQQHSNYAQEWPFAFQSGRQAYWTSSSKNSYEERCVCIGDVKANQSAFMMRGRYSKAVPGDRRSQRAVTPWSNPGIIRTNRAECSCVQGDWDTQKQRRRAGKLMVTKNAQAMRDGRRPPNLGSDRPARPWNTVIKKVALGFHTGSDLDYILLWFKYLTPDQCLISSITPPPFTSACPRRLSHELNAIIIDVSKSACRFPLLAGADVYVKDHSILARQAVYSTVYTVLTLRRICYASGLSADPVPLVDWRDRKPKVSTEGQMSRDDPENPAKFLPPALVNRTWSFQSQQLNYFHDQDQGCFNP